MYNLRTEMKPHLLFFYFLLLFVFVSCSNKEDLIEKGIVLTDSWICDIESIIEDSWRYELYLDDNYDYIGISDNRIIKVSKDGLLLSNSTIAYSDDDNDVVRIYNDKIYRFHYFYDYDNFDPLQKIKLQIFDTNMNLITDYELDSNGWILDVEIESDNLVGMLVYDTNENTTTLKKLHLTDGLVSEIVLSESGTFPNNLYIAETGEYYCTDSSNRDNLFYLDNNLNLIWAKEFSDFLISDAKFVPGHGLYITGRTANFDIRFNYAALIDENGVMLNSFEYDPGERYSPRIQINNEKLCLVQTEPESNKNLRLLVFDFDLNLESTIDIPGNLTKSNIVLNEGESFSFIYGIAVDPNDPEFFPVSNPRIFKLDNTYALPTNIIIQ